jgi:uncharacterized protein YbaR (Trm112 family)
MECPKCKSRNIQNTVESRNGNKPLSGVFICNNCKEIFLGCPYCNNNINHVSGKGGSIVTREVLIKCEFCSKIIGIGFYQT